MDNALVGQPQHWFLTAKLTAKPADGDGLLCTVTARSLELAGLVNTGVRH